MIDTQYLLLAILLIVLVVLVTRSIFRSKEQQSESQSQARSLWKLFFTTGTALAILRLGILISIHRIEEREGHRYGPVPLMQLLRPEFNLFVPRGPIGSNELFRGGFMLVADSFVAAAALTGLAWCATALFSCRKSTTESP